MQHIVILENVAQWHFRMAVFYPENAARHETLGELLMWRAHRMRQQLSV